MLGGIPTLHGQDQASTPVAAPPTITTDRPAITDASTVVPSGELVFENGFTETGTAGQQGVDFPETLARFGLTSKTELRFTAPDYFHNFNTGSGLGSGFGDLSLGVKQQLFATSGGFDASLVASLSFPTGAQLLSSHGYDPSLQVPWSHPISKNWTAAGMFSLLWPTEGPKRNLTGQASFYIDRQLTSRWDAFVEYGGEFPQRGGPQNIIHPGTSFKLTPNQQLDFHFGFGLSSAAVDHFIGVGYSFQFQALHREK
jgi:outer membrane putative beta-barrel porin/alpha-amylase